MVPERNFFIALALLLMSFGANGNPVYADGTKTVMPVSASWGSEQAMIHSHLDNSGRQLALAPAKLPATETASEVASSKQMAEFADAVTVTARQLSKEGTKQFVQLTRWFAILFKQQSTPPTITPAAGPHFAVQAQSMQNFRAPVMSSITAKHPVWLLSNGRVKTVAAQ